MRRSRKVPLKVRFKEANDVDTDTDKNIVNGWEEIVVPRLPGQQTEDQE
jgi:hypothetical protein